MIALDIITKSLMGIALLVAIVRYNRINTGSQRYFIVYLVGMIILETLAALCVKQWGNNVLVYNLVDVFMTSFFVFLFYKTLKQKIWVFVLSAVAGIAFLVSIFFENWLKDFNVFFLFTATLVLLVLVFRFYIEFLNSDELVDFKTNPQFWATTGILIFYLGYLPIQVYISKIDGSLPPLMYSAIGFLNLPLYGCIIIALLCPQKQ